MKISPINMKNISFKGKRDITFREVPSSPDFIGNVALNSAVETMKQYDNLSFLPSGSWISGVNFDPKLSDHDLTILLPQDSSFQKMEAKIFDSKECFKDLAVKKFRAHKVPDEQIYSQILPSINIFPPPQFKECFNSYDQFREFTNLKISLHDSNDPDKGLWQMKNTIVKHFENEGSLLYKTQGGSVDVYRIKGKTGQFFDYVDQNGIYMPKDSTLYSSDKLKIINEFVDKMRINPQMDNRSFYKYLNRVKKFFFMDSQNDLFSFENDPRKNHNPKFEKKLAVEKEFKKQLDIIFHGFSQVKSSEDNILPEKYATQALKDLELFKRLSEEILSWPVIKGFKLN